MKVQNSYNTNTPSFGKFIKISGKTHSINAFRTELNSKSDRFMTLGVKKDKHKSILYLFSGKHFDEFIDIRKNKKVNICSVSFFAHILIQNITPFLLPNRYRSDTNSVPSKY